MVQPIGLGKRQGFPHKRAESLPQRVVPALAVRGVPVAFAAHWVLGSGQDGSIGIPEVGVTGRRAPRQGNLFPEVPAAFFAAISSTASDNLTSRSAQRYPHPGGPLFGAHKRPELVPFQGRGHTGNGGDAG